MLDGSIDRQQPQDVMPPLHLSVAGRGIQYVQVTVSHKLEFWAYCMIAFSVYFNVKTPVTASWCHTEIVPLHIQLKIALT